MKRRRTVKELQECLIVALPLLAKARELLEKAPEGSRRLTKVPLEKHRQLQRHEIIYSANSPEKNVSADECANSSEKHGSDEKHASEDDEGERSDETNSNFDMDEDIRERMTRRSVKMCKISGKLLLRPGEVTSIGPVKQLVRDAELAMGVEFRLLKADLDRYSDDPSRR